MIRNSSLVYNANIYPTLHSLHVEKQNCLPSGMMISETSAFAPLQCILDHTLKRIVEIPNVKERVMLLDDKNVHSGILYCKLGFDGASSQSVYKQKFDEMSILEEKIDEESLFQTALVPLLLTVDGVNVWVNKKPSSTHFCRPVKLQYKKESKELSKEEFDRVTDEIKNLSLGLISVGIDGQEFVSVQFTVDLTMFDGKVVNALTDTSSTQSCNVCGAKPSEMNNLKVIRQKKPNQEALALGISSLHCLLRTFEFILHLGYKMDIKKFRKSCSEDQISIETRKRSIQSRFKEEMSLVVDQPKQGFGNTNDGNTARKAFDHAEMFADITGVDLDIIISLRTILKAISS